MDRYTYLLLMDTLYWIIYLLLKNILKGSSRGIIQLSIPKEGRKSMVDLLWIFPSVDIDIEEKFKYL